MDLGTKVFLRNDVQVEPLIMNWFAWIHLLSPGVAALNLKNRYLKILDSYIESPTSHAMAVKDPRMKGGPFIDLGGACVEEVKALRDATVSDAAELLELAASLKELNQLLQSAKGEILESYYPLVPDNLKGLVELCYDTNHQPSFRFFESLLYKSKFYNPSLQSIALSVVYQDTERPFILSTPRILNGDSYNINIPFRSEVIDQLFSMKTKSASLESIMNALSIPVSDKRDFENFFTVNEPPTYSNYSGDNMRIRYFGHACILIESKNTTILIDPVLSYTYETDLSRYTYLDLPDKIDFVLITHSHQDHILMETMLQLRHKVDTVIVGKSMEGLLQDPSLGLALKYVGFRKVVEMREFDELPFDGGVIVGMPFLGEHHDLLINSKLSYYVKINGKSIMALADSCNIEPALYQRIFQETGPIDILFLGMECDGSPISWAYGPLFHQPIERKIDQTRRGRGCNFQEALSIVENLKCKQVYVYAMGQEPWLRHILGTEYTDESNPIIQSKKLLRHLEQHNTVAEKLFGEKELIF